MPPTRRGRPRHAIGRSNRRKWRCPQPTDARRALLQSRRPASVAIESVAVERQHPEENEIERQTSCAAKPKLHVGASLNV